MKTNRQQTKTKRIGARFARMGRTKFKMKSQGGVLAPTIIRQCGSNHLLAVVLLTACMFLVITIAIAAAAQQSLVVVQPQANLSHEPASNENPFASMLNSAVIDGKVNLPCDISPASQDDSVALILWYKDDSLAPIYTIDARKANSLDKAKTTVDESYTTRANFHTRTKPAQLQLERIRQEDEGDYRCRVDFKRGRTVNTIIALRVIVPPEDISIALAQKPHLRLVDHIGPFNEGSELSLVCLATGGKPRPQITWRRDYNVIDETYQHVDKTGTSVALKIPALSKNHLLSKFTCQASNNNISSPKETSITLDLNLKPQEVSLRQLQVNEPLIVGQTATFECTTHGSRPQATIHWLFQGSQHNPPINVDQQQSSSRLTLSLQRSFNQQPLACVAENPRIPGSAIRQTIKLDVHYPPQLSVKIEPQSSTASIIVEHQNANNNSSSNNDSNEPNRTSPDANVSAAVAHLQEGNDIYLTCAMDSNPRPAKPILWRFNGRPIQLTGGSMNMIVMNNQSLVLRKISRQQSGLYTCEASNQHGFNSSKPLELLVRHAPVCSTDDILVYEASIGQTVPLDCRVQANPFKSVHYSWFLAPNEQNFTDWLQRDASLDEQIDEFGSKLKYKIKDEHDFGLLKCKAKNEIGLQQRPCFFHIVPAPMPTMHHSCSLVNASATTLQLSCKLNEHLKSEDFEVIKNNSETATRNKDLISNRNGMRGWLNLEAIKNGNSNQANSDSSLPVIPNSRVVFPPSWLMAELYKMDAKGLPDSNDGDNRANSEQQQQNFKLVAYVIVSSSQQLAHVKSIVEENGLFSEKPKSVYYVMAKQTDHERAQEANNRTLGVDVAPGDAQIVLANGATPLDSVGAQIADHKYLVDPSIQLASSFAFVVPKLEPMSRYKLLIYGQNMANKTRDWIVVSGETLRENPYSSLAQSSGQKSRLIGENLLGSNRIPYASSELNDDSLAGSRQSNFSSLQQKSIVMRSDLLLDHNGQQTEQQANQLDGPSSRPPGVDSSSDEENTNNSDSDNNNNEQRFSSGVPAFVNKQVQQLQQYKELAVYYAKQKPLLAVPMAVTVLLILSLMIIWTIGFLVQLARGRPEGRNRRRPSSMNGDSEKQSRSGSLQADCTSYSGKVVGAASNDDKHRKLSQSDDGNKTNGIGKQQDQRQFANNQPYLLSSPDESYESASGSGTQNHNQLLADQVAAGNMSLLGDDSQLLHLSEAGRGAANSIQQGRNRNEHDIYTIEPIGQVHLEEGVGALGQHLGTFASVSQLANRQFVGSLDRRTLQAGNSAIYLTDTSGAKLIQVHEPQGYGQQRQQVHYQQRNVNSMDRRHPARLNGGAANQETLFVADLSQLDPRTIYMSQQRDYHSPQDRCLANESFSSTECSSELNHSQTGRAKQRVAFDLSNQAASSRHQPAPKPRSLAANGSQAAGQLAAKQHLESSGGSSSNNSGITADSGHESPPTNEGSATSYLPASEQLRHGHAPNCSVITRIIDQCAGLPGGPTLLHEHSGLSASPNELQLLTAGSDCCSASNGAANGQQASGANNGLVMFMELSPSSQESATLLHSVESFAEPAPLVGHHNLQNNHQMATSFGLQAPSKRRQQHQRANGNNLDQTLHIDCNQADVDHWL